MVSEIECYAIDTLLSSFVKPTDKGVFAGVSGTGGTEKNGEEGNAKTNGLSQLTKIESQTKRARLDPQETSQKTALYNSSSKLKLSSDQSQFSQASKQQTSMESGEKLIMLCKNSEVFFPDIHEEGFL